MVPSMKTIAAEVVTYTGTESPEEGKVHLSIYMLASDSGGMYTQLTELQQICDNYHPYSCKSIQYGAVQ